MFCMFCGAEKTRDALEEHMDNCVKFKPTSPDLLQAVHAFLNTRRSIDATEYAAASRNSHASSSSSIRSDQEQCKHCKRVFKKGRCASHEAVCQTVFMGRTLGFSWKANSARDLTLARHSETSRPQTRKPHSLLGSYKEYNNNLVQCRYCGRKFAPAGAERHMEICRKVENRPKAHVTKL